MKRNALFIFGKKYNTDFCFFQESHSTVNDCNFWKSQWGNDAWFSHGSESLVGVLTLKNKFAGDVLHYYFDPCWHFIFWFFTLITFFFFLINMYGYNSSNENRARFEVIENKIALWLNKYPSGIICIGGDFNIAPDNMLDCMPPKKITLSLLSTVTR